MFRLPTKANERLKVAPHVWMVHTPKALNKGSTRKVHLMLARRLLLKTVEEHSLPIQRQGANAARKLQCEVACLIYLHAGHDCFRSWTKLYDVSSHESSS